MLSDWNLWIDLSDSFFNTASTAVVRLNEALGLAEEAVSAVLPADNIGTLTLSITSKDIEDHNENRRKLVFFCNGIHYEVNELIDNPFSLRMSDAAEAAYALNPKDIKVTTGHILFFPVRTSLMDLVSSTIDNEALKNDFVQKCKSLDQDKPSADLIDCIKEAYFWKDQYEIADRVKDMTAKTITDEVRSQWPNMTPDEREQVLTAYAIEVGAVYSDYYASGLAALFPGLFGSSLVSEFTCDSEYLGESNGDGHIAINPDFRDNPVGNYSLDKVLDTINHETRHEFQAAAKNDPDKYRAPQSLIDDWSQPYIPSTSDFDAYYRQDVERDARGFAAATLN